MYRQNKLMESRFIREIKYLTWIAKEVLVKKTSGKLRMHIYFTDLNQVCPKDPYTLYNINRLIGDSSRYRTLSFMDVYSRYN